MSKEETREPDSELLTLRQQIDDIDDRIITLLKERAGIVSQVGNLKHRSGAVPCAIRAGREATMLRRIYGLFKGGPFAPAAAASMWRMIISASTAMEKELKISVYSPDKDPTYYWLAREYFGAFTPVFEQYAANRVVGDILDDKAGVGILPYPRNEEVGQWWLHLAQGSDDFPKIFAHVPFVVDDKPGKNNIAALAIARVEPEPTGDDISFIAVEVEHDVSQHRLQSALATAKLQSSWVSVVATTPQTRYHLIEVKGFVTHDHTDIQKFLSEMGNAIVNFRVLGSYASPIVMT